MIWGSVSCGMIEIAMVKNVIMVRLTVVLWIIEGGGD